MANSAEKYHGILSIASDKFSLVNASGRLELHQTDGNFGPLYVDFLSGSIAYRRHYGGGRRQLIARAVGLKKGSIPYVVDATAGLGRDAFVLACLGCKVHMVERSPIVGALLNDGLVRALADPSCKDLLLTLTVTDAITYLGALSVDEFPDVIYLDPMFPPRTKSALVKKEMRYLKALVGDDEDASILLKHALRCAKKRVVVKRSKCSSSIEGPKPSLEFKGISGRFDVYLCQS